LSVSTDYYAVLGVRPDATQDEIKRAYRRLARQLHPDVNKAPDSEERFKDVSRAYDVLSDPEKRRVHDLGGDPFAGAGGMPGGSFTGFGLGDLFDAFLGGPTSRGPRPRTRPGADALIRLDLELVDTAFGTTRDIVVDTALVCHNCGGAGTASGTHPATCGTCRGRGEVSSVSRSFLGQVMTSRACPECGGTGTVIPNPCPECAGDGRVRARRTLAVKIPPGVEHGMRIRLSGEGEVGPGGGPPGDLYVEVNELPHPVLQREGDQLHCQVTLPMTAAALGTTIKVPALDGEEELDIRAGVQSGERLTLRGKGVPMLRGSGRGDLIVHVEVTTPIKLDGEQEQLLREFARLRGEEAPPGLFGQQEQSGLFSRLRDAWGGGR
jgi:molecular chaperone DnaJ